MDPRDVRLSRAIGGQMGKIRVLGDPLVNRIAAGEVVERPASVVKELVENSLDAGAGSVEAVVGGGGRRKIRVSDDGTGMDRDDALLALERHATSKLAAAEDLDAIATLGFRGEALPSIAAVSRFTLRTAPRDGVGTEVEVRGGRIVAVREAGLPRGTTVDVESLFFNVPARRKFLRSEATELAHIVRLLTRYALAYPGVRFLLEHDAGRLLDLPRARDVEERAGRLFGAEAARRLLPFSSEHDGIRVHGLAGRPADAPARRDAQHLFVNRRVVMDRILAHAISEAYGNTVPRDRHPAMVLFVEIDPARVDVNVHPQKLEVRFARSGEVHDLVRDAVSAALGHGRAVPDLTDLRPLPAPSTPVRVAEAVRTWLDGHGAQPPVDHRALCAPPPPTGSSASRASAPPASIGPAVDLFRASESAAASTAVPLAQFRDSYIVAEDRGGILIVDQHAAHERVLFERFLSQADADRVPSQPLLFPIVVELPAHERVLLEEEMTEFRRLGFRVEPFGGEAVRVEAVPAVAAELDPGVLLRDLIGEARRARSTTSSVEPLRRRLVTTAACKAAIKVNHPLSREEMQQLLDSLLASRNPTTCPHGRPVLFRLTLEEIERAFRRR